MICGYSILHFLTDGLCAFAMFGKYASDSEWYLYMLIYNFCAFALQMPFGALMDVAIQRFKRYKGYVPVMCCISGILLTCLGSVTNPAVLGIGNALFHVGGGIDTMKEDREKKKNGALLGIFVSPGAIGLFLGTYLAKSRYLHYNTGIIIISLIMLVVNIFLILMTHSKKKIRQKETIDNRIPEYEDPAAKNNINMPYLPVFYTGIAVFSLFTVVVIRSYTGMNIPFSWKTGFLYGFVSVLFLALGKAAGGILSSAFGMKRVMVISLIVSAVMYYFSDIPACGLLALFTFNMTMPITLYLLADRFKDYPGTSFGILTLALFIGFLPAWMKLPPVFQGNILGMIMSIVSLLILYAAFVMIQKGIKE